MRALRDRRWVDRVMRRSAGGRNRIAYQGEAGANSHLACLDVFPEETFRDFEPVPHASFDAALEAIESDDCALGMIPIENSANGRVADIHRLMPKSDLRIVGEYFMPIHHCLMAPPGATLEGLKSVQSHEQAIGQCRKTIQSLGLKEIIGTDTAGSARAVAAAGDPTRAAIAPALAAEIYKLSILRRNVEDEPDNTTRFVILSRRSPDRNGEHRPRSRKIERHNPDWPKPGQGLTVTTFVFKVKNIPAALYKALGGFATNGVNMTKLESYQLEGKFTATQFYADVEGHPQDPPLKRALDELEFFSSEAEILGVYPAHKFRVAERALEAEAALRR